MIRPVVLLLFLFVAGTVQAEGLNLTDAERDVFRKELRDAILADPGPVAQALAGPSLYAEAVAQDKERLSEQADLFASTARGYGADAPRLTIVFFETYPCADCAAAWTEVEALLARHPDIRVEPRFAAPSGPAQLLLSVLEHQGPERYRQARQQLMAARTDEDLKAVFSDRAWVQDRMFRPAPMAEAAAFQALDLQSAPAFVFPDLMLQGTIPAIVLEKYIAR